MNGYVCELLLSVFFLGCVCGVYLPTYKRLILYEFYPVSENRVGKTERGQETEGLARVKLAVAV